jgi:hypothetical protein
LACHHIPLSILLLLAVAVAVPPRLFPPLVVVVAVLGVIVPVFSVKTLAAALPPKRV